MFVTYLLVGLGGAIGSIVRFWLNGLISQRWDTFPMGTMVINITGSFAITFFATLTGPEGRWLAPSNGRIFFMTGVCGGYTTFSSFSRETLNLALDGEWGYAMANAGFSFILCLVAAWLGHAAALSLKPAKGV